MTCVAQVMLCLCCS